MRLIIEPIYTYVEGDYVEMGMVERLLVAPNDEDQEISLLDNNRFYTGLLSRVEEILLSNQVEYELDWTYDPDFRTPDQIIIPDNFLPGIELRPHQIAAPMKLIARGGRGVVNVATGGGKTEIGCVIAKYYQEQTIFVNDRIKHAVQAQRRFQKYGIDCGILGGGERDIDHMVVSCVANSLHTGIRNGDNEVWDLLQRTKLLEFDECHHLQSNMWTSIGEHCKAHRRTGLSASVFEDPNDRCYEDMLLIGQTGEVVCYVPPRWLIDRGYLAEPLIHYTPINTPRPKSMDWMTVYKEGIVNNTYRNYIIAGYAEILRNYGFKVLILVQRIDHGKNLLNLLKDPSAVFSYGGDQMFQWEDGHLGELNMAPEDFVQQFEAQTSGILIGCFTGDTRIPLLDGSEKTLQELEGRSGFEVYSRNPETKFIEGAYARCFKTGSQVPVYRITLDNGLSEKCTAEHLWMLRDGSYQEAAHLQPGDSLMPLYRRYDEPGYEDYEMLYQPDFDTWIPTHRVQAFNIEKPDRPRHVGDKDLGGWVVHHKNVSKHDNTRENIQWLRWRDHYDLHQGFGFVPLWKTKEFREKRVILAREQMISRWQDPEYANAQTRKFTDYARSDGGREVRRQNMIRYNKSHEKQIRTTELNLLGVSGWKLNWADPCYRDRLCARISVGMKAAWDKNYDKRREAVTAGNRNEHKRQEHSEFMKDLWKRRKNHTVVSVEFVGHEDVYDVEVAGYNNFALSSGVLVHNSTVYDESIDIPSMTALIMAGGGRKNRRVIQRVGRASHSKEEFVHVFDFWDFQHPYLQKHSRVRLDTYSHLEYKAYNGLPEFTYRTGIQMDPQRVALDWSRRMGAVA